MKIETNIRDILELTDRPSFCACGGVITEANQAALDIGISPETAVASLLRDGTAEYNAFTEGVLYLTIHLHNRTGTVRVSKLGTHDWFVMEQEEADAHLQSYALAAQALRGPLNQVMTGYERLLPGLEAVLSGEEGRQLLQVNKGLYQLLRLVGNLSDARTAGIARMELRDLTAVLAEIAEHAQSLCAEAGIPLHFTNHPVSVYSLVDSQKLERAIYNLISNAMKHTAPGGAIQLQFARRGATAYLTVTDSGIEKNAPLSPGAFTKFLREPGLGSHRDGLGLGMALVRAVAAAHHGTVLFKPLSGGGMQVILSLPIRQDTPGLGSPALRIDYAGEWDHGLVELSEFLPPELYSSKY